VKQPAIRVAREEDFAGLLRLFTEENLFHASLVPESVNVAEPVLTPEELLDLLEDESIHLLVADVEGEVAGAVLAAAVSQEPDRWLPARRYAYVREIAVAGDRQGQGVGRLLMQAVCDWAASRGMTEVELHVWEKNRGAIDFYESLGYETARRIMRLVLD